MKNENYISKKPRFSWIYLFGFLFLGYSLYVLTIDEKDHLKCPVPIPSVQPILETRAQMKSKLIDGLVLLESAPKLERLGSDMELPGWRQTSSVLYLLGKYDIARSFVLINATCTRLCVSVFLPILSEREIIFNGAEVDKDQVKRDFLLDNVYDIDELAHVIQNQKVFTTSKNTWEALPKDIQSSLHNKNAVVEYSQEVEQAFLQSRFIKTRAELELLKYASQTAMFTHNVIEKYIKTSAVVTESQTAKYFEYVSSLCGSYLQSYNPIVGSGKHAGVLHFPTGETIDGGSLDIPEKDFILIDAAGAYNGYASDITRTYARKSSKKLRLLSSIVFKSQQAGIAAHKLGNNWSDVVNASLNELTRGLWEHGFLIANDLDTLIDSGVISIFMPHGVGHPVGLEVHDPVPALHSQPTMQFKGLRDEYPLKLKFDYPIQKGNVHTVEPGVYFIPYLLNKAKNNDTLQLAHLINWDVIEEWKDVGGVRIEDVVAIDLDGTSVVLSKL